MVKAVKRAVQFKLLTVPREGRRDWKEQFAAIKKAVAAVKEP